MVFPSRLGSFHPGNWVKRAPFHSDIRRRRFRRGTYTQYHRLVGPYVACVFVSESSAPVWSGWPSSQRERLTLQGGRFLMIPSRLRPSLSRHLQRRIAIDCWPSNRGACRGAARSGGLLRKSFRSRPRHPPLCWRFEPGAMRELHWTPRRRVAILSLRVRLRWLFIWGGVTR